MEKEEEIIIKFNEDAEKDNLVNLDDLKAQYIRENL